MDISGFVVQLLNGLAGASSLFLVGAGLSLIFGVTRIVNFAHGSFYMLGIYIAYSLVARMGGGAWFWPALLLASLLVGAVGAIVEMTLLRRIYKAPELLQLLATFALVLVIKDATLWLWGSEELLGPRAPGLSGSVMILGRQFPSYDLFLIVVGPVVLGALWMLLTRTRWGTLVRAATQDREMVSALGVNQVWLFTSVFALGAMLAGLGGALQLPREPANLEMDLHTIGSAFVVVVVGGMGSIPGAYVSALLIAELKALCIWLGLVEVFGICISFSKLTLVVEFLVMAIVLVVRPWGLMGKAQAASRSAAPPEAPLRRADRLTKIAGGVLLLALLAWPVATASSPYHLQSCRRNWSSIGSSRSGVARGSRKPEWVRTQAVRSLRGMRGDSHVNQPAVPRMALATPVERGLRSRRGSRSGPPMVEKVPPGTPATARIPATRSGCRW